ncbi:MAG: hypothetical protein AAGI48_09345 [Verrucomicrobiota bacterium]
MKDESKVCRLAEKIEEAEERIGKLGVAIEEIGQPAAKDLSRRLEALKIEEKALKRNFKESLRGEEDASKMEKVEALLRHIEAEESSVEHAAAFLHQGAPSTVVMAAEAGARVVDKVGRGVKKVIGSKVSESMVFVNHSHDTLVERYGLEESEEVGK